ncbi:epididymal-specific lipocalin-5-like [Acomys russatus]|uniref:epididymal-specific lipocalin-5-like n=1 Tax=Acomys russatus TaxID=60746 RepID=UPI0021E29808|nr:epididymal-specific lipocalin-5-like [Acomys russatus]
MESIMFFTLLGLCVGLAAGTQEAGLKSFDLNKFLGFWYEIAFASKITAYDSAPKEVKMGAMVVNMEENLLALTTTYYNEDHCVLEKVGAAQADHPGKFKVTRISGNKEVVVVDTDYKTYAIMDITFPVAGEVQRAMNLYSRSLDHTDEALSKFQKKALEHGFSARDINVLKRDCE